jgi:hypothetical protein
LVIPDEQLSVLAEVIEGVRSGGRGSVFVGLDILIRLPWPA